VGVGGGGGRGRRRRRGRPGAAGDPTGRRGRRPPPMRRVGAPARSPGGLFVGKNQRSRAISTRKRRPDRELSAGGAETGHAGEGRNRRVDGSGARRAPPLACGCTRTDGSHQRARHGGGAEGGGHLGWESLGRRKPGRQNGSRTTAVVVLGCEQEMGRGTDTEGSPSSATPATSDVRLKTPLSSHPTADKEPRRRAATDRVTSGATVPRGGWRWRRRTPAGPRPLAVRR